MKFRKNILLKNYTTFRIGGKTKYFFIAKNKEDLISAIEKAKELKLPFFVLGGGSNLLVSDKGYEGLVIKIQNTKYRIEKTRVFARAGTSLSQLVRATAKAGLSGLEWAAGIPGTIGGAIYGNAGWSSNKKNISSTIEWIEVLEVGPEFKIKHYKLKDCRFGYRDSIFKHKPGLVILSAYLKLKKGDKAKIKKEISDIFKKKREKIPPGFSAGSIFKNFTPYRNKVSGTGPKDLKGFKKTGMIPAACLIEKCGLKGKRIGGAEISDKHANFIINLGKAKAEDVKKLINLAKKSVKKKFKIILEEEIEVL